MPKASLTLRALHPRARAVRWIRLLAASAVLVGLGSLSSLVIPGLKPAGAAGEGPHPGIFRIPLDTALTEHRVYPPGIALGDFDGAYTMATCSIGLQDPWPSKEQATM
jgi:hypothetical protein